MAVEIQEMEIVSLPDQDPPPGATPAAPAAPRDPGHELDQAIALLRARTLRLQAD